MRLGVFDCAAIVPNAADVAVRFGAENATRFVRLKVSNRTCTYFLSPKLKFFSSEASRFFTPSARRLLNVVFSVRILSAGCKVDAVTKAAVLKTSPFG